MKYVIVFSLFALYLLALAVLLGGLGWLLLWPAVSFLLLAAAYAGLGPRIYGKRPDGRLAWWAVLLLLPFLLLTWGLWHLARLFSKEACAHEVAPGLWVGRRPFAHELPPDVGLVVDLTAEFIVARGVTTGRSYLCLPTLDALAPDEGAVRELVAAVAGSTTAVYIHCAAGHGRSAMVAAAVLLARGLAADAKEAEALLRKARPGIRLTPSQRQLLERLRSGGPQ
jgi:protein-tyrosine phosphatase